MFSKVNNQLFKKIIILFWTLWWLIALWTDIVGALAHLGWLHASWAQDTNYPFLVSTLEMYHVPAWLPPFLYAGIILWTGLSSIVFIWASLGLTKETQIWIRRAEKAFIISICLWLAFFYRRSNCNEI